MSPTMPRRKVDLLKITALSSVLTACMALVGAQAQVQENPVVKQINIQGLERVSEQLIRSQLEVQPGQNYSPAAVARDIRRLYGLGHFDTIEVDAAPADGGLTLTYSFEEKRIIDEVKIIGNKKLKTSKVRGVLSWKEGDSFGADAYDEERKAILKLYEQKGFANTSVDINVEKVGPSRVRVTYVVTEGAKARIRNISFEGNEVLSDKKLRKTMKTKRAFLFFGGRYNEDKLETDLTSILDQYGNIGHLDAAIAGTEMEYSPNGKRMSLTVRLNEGGQYKVGSIEPVNNVVYGDDEVYNVIKVKPGDVHNKGQVAEDADMIAKGYHGSGYVNADVGTQVTLNRDEHTTAVTYNISEGDLKYIRKIDITGNETTKDDIIRRQLLIQPGDRFDGNALRWSQMNLENTRYFENSRLTLRDVENSDMWNDLLVDVEEGKTGNFNFGAGYSTEEKTSGFLELRLNNFDISNWPTFSGGGQLFATRLQIGAVRTEYNLTFEDPEIFGYPLAFGFSLMDESYEFSESANYTEHTTGGNIMFGKTLSPFVRVRTTIGYTEVDYDDLVWKWLYTPEWRRELESSTTISNSWAIERDTRDIKIDPTSGSKHMLVATVAGFGGDNEFLKVEHDSTWYWGLGAEKKWILSFRTREGWAGEYGSSDYVPLAYRLFAGGTDTVRGYDNRDIGPKERRFWFFDDDKESVGGESRLVNNLELKYKLTDKLRFYTFVDSGGVWDSGFDLGDIKYSTGIGFGVDIPRLGPIRVDYGVPINPDDDQGNGRLHLKTGLSF